MSDAPADVPWWRRVVARVQRVLDRWQASRPGRANARFGAAGGGLLTGGIAYATLFSLAAGLTLGWTLFMALLGGNAELRAGVVEAVDSWLPGLLDTGDGSGLVDPDRLRLSAGLSVAGVVAVVVLVVSAVSAMSALRTALRAMFGERGGNAVVGKLRELGGLATVAATVLVSALLTLGTTAVLDPLLRAIGLAAEAHLVLRVAGVALAFLVDAATFVLLVRLLAGVDPPRRDLLGGAAIAGVGLGAVRLIGASVVAGSAGANAVLASFATLGTLLVWVNLVARIVLLAAAWTADPPPPAPPAPAAPAPAG